MPLAVGTPLVPPHDVHPPEADALVASDGALVGDRRVDGNAVVAAFPEEVVSKRPDGPAPRPRPCHAVPRKMSMFARR